MALALNNFKSVTAEITTADTAIYTAPTSYTGIVLMAQITNVTNSTQTVTVSTISASTSAETELFKNFSVPAYDAVSAISGKLVLQTGDQLSVSASTNSSLKITLSVLETANQ
jgi:general stress protein CsbA